MSQQFTLQQTLRTRHVSMIAIGGVIGAGVFVGSGSIIASAGPAAILSFLIGGFIVSLVMFMLGEMAARRPDAGSFSTYAGHYLGDWAGYSVGWIYWFKYMISIAVEGLLLGSLINEALPAIPVHIGAFAMIALVVANNMYSARSFGEFEYWLSLVKIVAIVAFLGIGVMLIMGILPSSTSIPLRDSSISSGFMPMGFPPVIAGTLLVFFSFGGSEIAAIAAGESDKPRENVVKAMRAVLIRVCIFYVGTILILVSCISWKNTDALKSPYVALYQIAGLKDAALVMKAVLFVSFLSVMNSATYATSRMLFSLSERGNAPKLFSRTAGRGVPRYAIAIGFATSSGILIVHYLGGSDLFASLAKNIGLFWIVIWLFIVGAHYQMNRQHSPETSPPIFGIRLYPWANVVSSLILVAIFILQAFDSHSRVQVAVTLISTAIIVGSYLLIQKRRSAVVLSS